MNTHKERQHEILNRLIQVTALLKSNFHFFFKSASMHFKILELMIIKSQSISNSFIRKSRWLQSKSNDDYECISYRMQYVHYYTCIKVMCLIYFIFSP